MSQSEQFHEAWAYLRDNAKPVEPHDVWDLRVVREQLPPSKAHIKRLQRARPVVTIARRKPPIDQTPRVKMIEAMNYGLIISKMVRPNYHKGAAPVARVHAEQGQALPLTPDLVKLRFDQRIAEAVRLANVARGMGFGPARKEVLSRATQALKEAIKCV